jgi:hypothetical protein
MFDWICSCSAQKKLKQACVRYGPIHVAKLAVSQLCYQDKSIAWNLNVCDLRAPRRRVQGGHLAAWHSTSAG